MMDFTEKMMSIKAAGGADECEDVFTGMEKTINLSWAARNRIVIHIADAPCHGTEFHSGCNDSYPAGDAKGRSAADLLRRLRDHAGVSAYLFCHLNTRTHHMLKRFKELVAADQAEEWLLEKDFKDVASIPAAVMMVTKATVSKSLALGRGFGAGTSRGAGMTLGGTVKYIPMGVVKAVPDFSPIGAVEGIVLSFPKTGSSYDLIERIRSKR